MDGFVQEVVNIARNAGMAIKYHYQSNYEIHTKKDNSPVTIADKESQEIINSGLTQLLDIPILGEENIDDLSRLTAPEIWIVDPLDGTKDFIHKQGGFSVLIAMVKDGMPEFGLVYDVLGDDVFYAQKGKGAYNFRGNKLPDRISVQPQKKPVAIYGNLYVEDSEKEFFRALGVENSVINGSLGLNLARIGRGDANIYVNSRAVCSEWDLAAPHIVLEEAGGTVTDVYGKNLELYNKSDVRQNTGIIASDGSIHDKAVNAFRDLN